MNSDKPPTGFQWERTDSHLIAHSYLEPAIRNSLSRLSPTSVLDLGSGAGGLTGTLAGFGFNMTGLEYSAIGVQKARLEYPGVKFEQYDILEAIPEELGSKFDVVIAVEVIEHLFLPRMLFARAREFLRPGGRLIVTTPYHSYLKNLALSATGKMESHFSVLADYGHIKFFSRNSLRSMAVECGFAEERFDRLGRVAPIAASMMSQFYVSVD